MACGAAFVLGLALSISSIAALTPRPLPCRQSLKKWSPRNRALVDCINKQQTTWTAKFNRAFENFTTLEEFRNVTGSLEETNETDATVDPPTREKRESEPIPESFDARQAWPECPSIGQIRNQLKCGSCWAVSVAGAASDRTCICLNATRKPELSSEDVLWCSSGSFGCSGGYPSRAWQFWLNAGIVTGGEFGTNQGCMPYAINPPCKQQCRPGYWRTYAEDKDKEGVSLYRLSSVSAIQRDIMQYGPVTAAFSVYTDFMYLGSGVYQRTGGSFLGGHAVRIIGWGTERGVPYWLCANQWGTGWGENGFFKFLRGSNHLNIEGSVLAGRCGDEVKRAKCSGVLYNPAIQGCCCGVIYYLAMGKCCRYGIVVMKFQTCPYCGGRPYNPFWQGCCRGRIYNRFTRKCCVDGRIIWSSQPCTWSRCNGRPYNPILGLRCCAGKKLYSIYIQKCCPGGWVVVIERKCPLCRGRPYNPNTHACCRGRRIYNMFTHKCCPNGLVILRHLPCVWPKCNGRPFNPSMGLRCCFGKTIYSIFTQKCCRGGWVVVKGKECPFCRGRPYYPGTHACCRARAIYNKFISKCCPDGRVVLRFLPCKWPRCNRRPYNPFLGQRCCGRKRIYNKSTQKCCPYVLVVPKRKKCPLCRLRPYNPETHQCCYGLLVWPRNRLCPPTRCNGRSYNSFLGQRCCVGKRIYNILTQKCCPYGWVVPKRRRCPLCRLRPYNIIKTHQCCYGLWLWPKNQLCPPKHFCKGRPYNPRTHRCCAGRIYRNFTHFCCRNRVYRKYAIRCCRNGRVVVGRFCLVTIKRP